MKCTHMKCTHEVHTLLAANPQAAQRFAHLRPAVEEAMAAFDTRRRGAEAALDAAVAGSPMQVTLPAVLLELLRAATSDCRLCACSVL